MLFPPSEFGMTLRAFQSSGVNSSCKALPPVGNQYPVCPRRGIEVHRLRSRGLLSVLLSRRMRPLLLESFLRGDSATGDPPIHAGRRGGVRHLHRNSRANASPSEVYAPRLSHARGDGR